MATKLQYSYHWGKKPVNELVERHARGTENLCTLLSLSRYEVRHKLTLLICSGNSVLWRSVKLLIKALEDYSYDDLIALSLKERKVLYKCLRSITDGEALDELSYREVLDRARTKPLSF